MDGGSELLAAVLALGEHAVDPGAVGGADDHRVVANAHAELERQALAPSERGVAEHEVVHAALAGLGVEDEVEGLVLRRRRVRRGCGVLPDGLHGLGLLADGLWQ